MNKVRYIGNTQNIKNSMPRPADTGRLRENWEMLARRSFLKLHSFSEEVSGGGVIKNSNAE
jgi:hypothetical protein